MHINSNTGITWCFTLANNEVTLGGGDTTSLAVQGGGTGDIVVPNSIFGCPVTAIAAYAFHKSEMTSVVIPEGVKTIGESAFRESSLIEVELPSTLKTIGKYAFYCSNVKVVRFVGKNEPNVEYAAFAGTSIDKMVCLSSPTNWYINSSGEDYLKQYNVFAHSEWYHNGSGYTTYTTKATVKNFYCAPEYYLNWIAHFNTIGLSCDVARVGNVVIISLNQGGEIPFTQQNVAWGDQVDVTVITKEGYIFLGWQSNVAGIENEGTRLSFTMPEQDVALVASFIAKSTRDDWINDAINSKIEQKELITAEQLQVMAIDTPVIEVKNGEATVGLTLKKAATLDGEWSTVELKNQLTTVDDNAVKVKLNASEKAAFYKFVVPQAQP